MKSLLLWLAAIVGGGAVGAVGGTAWLVFTGAGAAEEVVEGVPTGTNQTEESEEQASMGVGALEAGTERPPSDVADPDSGTGPQGGDPRSLEVDTPSLPEVPRQLASASEAPEPASSTPPPGGGSAGAPPDAPIEPNPNHERLGRIFAAMKAEEAASVLGQLDDREIQGILMTMPARNAAPILARLDPARAASLSRRVLGEGGS